MYSTYQKSLIFCSITPTNSGQLSEPGPGTVLKSAHPEDSWTVPDS